MEGSNTSQVICSYVYGAGLCDIRRWKRSVGWNFPYRWLSATARRIYGTGWNSTTPSPESSILFRAYLVISNVPNFRQYHTAKQKHRVCPIRVCVFAHGCLFNPSRDLQHGHLPFSLLSKALPHRPHFPTKTYPLSLYAVSTRCPSACYSTCPSCLAISRFPTEIQNL